ncbi:MAG: hypothetical protein ACXWI5_11765, partial [Croceibacterium sp.]
LVAQTQAQADPARLDDFAVAAPAEDVSHVEQLSPSDDRPRGSPQPGDRAIAAAQPVAAPTTDLSQISAKGQNSAQAQLSRPGSSPDESRAAVSSTADSRPQGVTHLGGQDRCDPQLAKEALERCRRILELRAQEFNAPAPPQLSAEQQFLAEQQAADEQRSVPSPATRLRLASRDAPDADLQSNQELAALYLGKQSPPPESSTPEDDAQAPTTDSALAQILNALQQPAGSAPPP